MKIAIFGCLHGMLDSMYRHIEDHETKSGTTIDLIIVCGDCQTIRHVDDLICLSVPDKYKKLGDFHEYYSGKKKIPKLTIFIGGNHEASNYLMTLPYGGWVCDNFYYLGYAGVIKYKGLRIAGVSGIYNYWNHLKGRYERLPLDRDSIKSIYHTRQLDIFRLQLLSRSSEEREPIDIFLSHDWPRRIYDFGNREQLMKFKPNFRQDIMSRDGLGSPMTQPLVTQLKPRRWFAAHLHCRFYAKVFHDKNRNRMTEFLSLNKIENGRNFMEVLDITPINNNDKTDEHELYYDIEWLTILRKTINLENVSKDKVFCPRLEDECATPYFPSEQEIQDTLNLMDATGGLKIERNFKMVEPVIYNRPDGIQPSMDPNRVRFYPNYQTNDLKRRLKLDISSQTSTQHQPGASSSSTGSQNEQVKIKKEDEQVKIKKEDCVKIEPNLKDEPKNIEVVFDEDGCLPYHIDKKRRF